MNMIPRTLSLIALGVATLGVSGCGTILHWQGLHPTFEAAPINMQGYRALIITTSQPTLGEDGGPTGVFGSELTHPYYMFADAGMDVDVASIKGGPVPIDPYSFKFYIITEQDERSLEDPVYQRKVNASLPITAVNPTDYDIVYIAGGWGAAYDLGQSKELGDTVSQARADGVVLGAVCHGPLGFIQAKEPDGTPLLKDKRMTAVTNEQLHELGVEGTPLHPETELRRAGVRYEMDDTWQHVFANHVVVDSNIVTGQNQNAGEEVAHRMMELAKQKPAKANQPKPQLE